MSVSIGLSCGGSVTIYPGVSFASNEATLTVIGPEGDNVVTQVTKDEARHIGESLLALTER